MQTVWYLFRHGLATLDPDGYGDKILTAELLPESIPIVRQMAKYLKDIDGGLWMRSEILRCKQTADIITEITAKKFVPDARLKEFYHETFPHLKNRVKGFVEYINEKNPDKVILCTHGAVIAAIRHLLFDGEFSESNLVDYPQCGQILEINQDKITVTDFNSPD